MPNKPATRQGLLAENEDLRARLAQAEEALRVMRSDEVDALVVSDVGGVQLFAPANADQSFRILVGEMSEGALTMTAEGVIVYANRHLAGMLKTPLEKVIGSAVRTWIASDSQPIFQSLLEKGAREERRAELVLAASDGSGMPVHLSVSNLPIEGRPDAYCLVAIDLTEHKRAEDDIRQSEERFRGLVEQSIAGIYIIQDDKLVYANQRYAEILGYASAKEVIGRERLFVVAEKDRAATKKRADQRLEAGHSASYEFAAVRKDGVPIELGVHSTRATHLGRPAIIGLMQDISEKIRAAEQIRRYVDQLEKAFMSTVNVATTLSEMRDPYAAGHERRVAQIAVAIGAELGFDARRQEGLRVAGHLHDVGKITVPAEILAKPGKLTAIEYQLIQGHAQASYDVLKDVEFPWPVAEVALQHHERIDGSGYPQGLKGEAILLEARIMAVADVVEAMSSHRPYRPGLGIDRALAEIERGRGTAYDQAVADACLKLFREDGYTLPV